MHQLPAHFENQAIRRVFDESTETWWFSGNVPVKVAFTGLNMGKLNVTAELASF